LVPQRHFGRCCGQNQSGAIGLSSQKETKCIQFELYKNVVREAFIKVMDWWKEAELIELIKEAAYSGQWRMLDNLYNNEYQQASSDLKEFLKEFIVNWAASGGQIDALEWAWD
jgi:hypothetical protein